MKVNTKDMDRMIEESYKPGFEIINAINTLGELAEEHGFYDDPKFKTANEKLINSMIKFQTMSFNRGMDLLRANTVIDELSEGRVGRYLVKKAKEKLGDRGL
jgi:hypothetical protein